MNHQLREFARNTIKDGLSQLPDGWQRTFKLMYGRNRGKRSVEDATAMSIEDVVNEVPDDELDRAMQQVEASLKKVGATSAQI